MILLFGSVLAGCFSNTEGVKPSTSELHFPTAAHITPGGRYLLVANSNFDLAWELGTLVMVDLDVVESMVRACPPEGCEPFEEYTEFVAEEETVLIGSYASFMALSPGGKRVYLTVRGTNSLTTVNLDEEAGSGMKLTCFDDPGGSRKCDSRHVIGRGETISLPPDPYALNTEIEGWVFVSHLTSNQVSIFSVDREEDMERDIPPRLLFVDASFPESVSSIRKHPLQDLLYATSRASSSVSLFRFVWDTLDYENDPRIYYGPPIRMNDMLNGDDARAIDFSSDGTLAFVTNRSPNSIVIADVSVQDGGWPRNEVLGVVALDQGPSLVKVWEPEGTGDMFVYATCYNADRIYVIDPFLRAKVDTIATGDGPHIMVMDGGRKFGYIVNFIESTVSVVDLDPASATFNDIRATLGKPKQVRRND
jgi:DNA-binding beta-propeller fold protein YncE